VAASASHIHDDADDVSDRRIYTNPAKFDENGRLRVSYFDTIASECPNCPRNMCKGRIIDRIRRRYDQRFTNGESIQYLYVGDGAGDYCPMTRLSSHDIAAVRRGFALEKVIDQRGGITAQIALWSDGKDMTDIVQRFIAD